MMLVMNMHAMGAYFAVTLFTPHMIVIMTAHRALHNSRALLRIVVFHNRYPLLLSDHGCAASRTLDICAGGSQLVGNLGATTGTDAVPARPGASVGSFHSAGRPLFLPHRYLCQFLNHYILQDQFHLFPA